MHVHGTKFRSTKANGEQSFPSSSKWQQKCQATVSLCRDSLGTGKQMHTHTYASTHLHVSISIPNTSISCMFMHVFFPHLTMWLQDPLNVPWQYTEQVYSFKSAKTPHCRGGPWFLTFCSELMVAPNLLLLQTLL